MGFPSIQLKENVPLLPRCAGPRPMAALEAYHMASSFPWEHKWRLPPSDSKDSARWGGSPSPSGGSQPFLTSFRCQRCHLIGCERTRWAFFVKRIGKCCPVISVQQIDQEYVKHTLCRLPHHMPIKWLARPPTIPDKISTTE